MNISDSERVSAVLESAKYKKTQNINRANLIAVVMCSVRQSAVDRVHGLVEKLKTIKKANPKEPYGESARRRQIKTILTGCILKKDKKIFLKSFDYVLDIKDIKKIPDILKINPRQISRDRVNYDKGNYLDIIPEYENKFSANVPIMTGCNNFCSYCVVPHTREREISRPTKEIISEIKNLIKGGCKKIWLLGQNVNSYKSGKIDFAGLLKLVNNIKGDFWLKLMTNHPKDMSDKLIRTMANCEKVCRHVHLPAQAGDDDILVAMNRKYAIAYYIKLVGKIRKVLNDQTNLKQNLWNPPAAITTDIIVGFPGETKKQFNNTAKLMREVKFDLAYIAKYSVRPGTAAAKLSDNVSGAEKKRRELELIKILRKTALENNKKYISQTVKTLVAGRSKAGEWFGKTATEKNVKFLMTNDKINLIWKFVNVKIIKAQDFGLNGEIINYESSEK